MPEFKADPPKPEPLRCCIHGNDLSCPGWGRCQGALAPSPTPRDPNQPTDASTQKAVEILRAQGADKRLSADELSAATLKLAAEIDAHNAKRTAPTLKLAELDDDADAWEKPAPSRAAPSELATKLGDANLKLAAKLAEAKAKLAQAEAKLAELAAAEKPEPDPKKLA